MNTHSRAAVREYKVGKFIARNCLKSKIGMQKRLKAPYIFGIINKRFKSAAKFI